MIWVTIVVSVLALAFTIVSFWWLHARPGRLRTWQPRAYASSAASSDNGSQKILLKLPLVLHNSGATPIVVENLRLNFSSDPEETPFFVLVAIHKQLYGSDSEREFATAFTVPGRSEIERIFEFQRVAAPVQLTDGSVYTFTLWAKAHGERRTQGPWLSRWLPSWHETPWRAFLELELRNVVWTGGIIPRDNRTDDEPDRAS